MPEATSQENSAILSSQQEHTARWHPDRARQFMPFAALKGYDELVREQEVFPDEPFELSEDEEKRLSGLLELAKKGDILRITHYGQDAYHLTKGTLVAIKPDQGLLCLQERAIELGSIVDIEIESAAYPTASLSKGKGV